VVLVRSNPPDRQQAAQIAEKAGAASPVAAAAKALNDRLVAVEGDITQMQGEATPTSSLYSRPTSRWWSTCKHVVEPDSFG